MLLTLGTLTKMTVECTNGLIVLQVTVCRYCYCCC